MQGLVTIVGGSGFLGRYIVQELVATGTRVRVAVRRPNAAMFLKPLGQVGQIQLIAADVRDERQIAAAMHGADAAVNLVGILAEARGRSFADIHAEGAATVARVAAGAGVRALVHVSAIGADAASHSAYGRSKAAGEAAVRAAFPAATILRPSLVFGPEDAFMNRFAALARVAPVMPVVAGNTRFQPVHVVDVARAVVGALENPARFGGAVFELGGPKVYTFRELLVWIMREIRVDKRLVDVPPVVAKLMARAGDILPGLPMTSDQYAMLQRDNVVGVGAPGLEAFGIRPTPLEAIAPAYLERYRRFGRFNDQRTATA
jgi:uncharacterized protein YbjT (DUF2867 family)